MYEENLVRLAQFIKNKKQTWVIFFSNISNEQAIDKSDCFI